MTRYFMELLFNTALHHSASSLEVPTAALNSNLSMSKTVTWLFFFNDVLGLLTYTGLKGLVFLD